MRPAPPTGQTAADVEISKTVSAAQSPRTPKRANNPLPKTPTPQPQSTKAAGAVPAPNYKGYARHPIATAAADSKPSPATQSTPPAPPDETTKISPQSPDETSP